MHKSIVICVLFSIVIAVVSAQCSCQTRPPIDRIYEACQCGCKSPPHTDAPKVTQYRDAHYDYGYKIENPQQSATPSEVKYSFDFHVEKPQSPPPSASLATYAFKVDAPSQKLEEQPKRYAFGYQIETPVVQANVATTNLEELGFKVDAPSQKSVEPPKRYAFEYMVETPITTSDLAKQHRGAEKGYGCKCNCFNPTLDILQSCPKHGHLYQSGGPLHPSNQQRYNQDPNLQQMPHQHVTILAERSKRDVGNNFPIKIQFKDLLPGLMPNNQINKILTAEQENQNRIDEIMKKNFGIEPEDNMEELVRPKSLNSLQSVQSEFDEDQNLELLGPVKLQKPNFIGKIKPKMQEIRNNMKSQISKIVNRVRLETILNNHKVQKRSSQSDNSELAGIDIDDVDYEPMRLTGSNDESHILNQNSENLPENVDENVLPNSERIRVVKQCDRCEELAKKYPCPSCGDISLEPSQPQYFEIKEGNAVPFSPRNPRQLPDHNTQPRYVFDRYGHRYIEHDGKLKLIVPPHSGDDVTVGSYYNGPDAYSEVKSILDRNSDKIHMTNRRIGEGHMLQPMNLAHAADAIRFIQELTHMNNNQYTEDYYPIGDSYDVGRSQNRPAKRSFKITPLAEDKGDGSVLVRISPTELKKPYKNGKKKYTAKSKYVTKAEDFQDSEENIFGDEKSSVKANFEKVVRDGKKYEILALSENGNDEGSVSSDENMEIVKYLYAANYKSGETDPSSKAIDSNNEETNRELQSQT